MLIHYRFIEVTKAAMTHSRTIVMVKPAGNILSFLHMPEPSKSYFTMTMLRYAQAIYIELASTDISTTSQIT